ncbi:hypothetical protein [Moorena sp. SIO3F7]|uniref:hypothetical protein n=1 Tax=Moorena sp. SIO3F7 TaxID=2607839 RepID=UPI0025F46B61|nr:hypothetical protein [Moorena sp. SIO3F7]
MQSLLGRGCVRNLRPHLESPVETPFGRLHRFFQHLIMVKLPTMMASQRQSSR